MSIRCFVIKRNIIKTTKIENNAIEEGIDGKLKKEKKHCLITLSLQMYGFSDIFLTVQVIKLEWFVFFLSAAKRFAIVN